MNEALFLQAGLVFAVTVATYLMLIRPQLRRLAAHQAFVTALKPGDRVVSGGSLIGEVVSCTGPSLTIAIADGVHVVVLRSSVEALPPSLANCLPNSAPVAPSERVPSSERALRRTS